MSLEQQPVPKLNRSVLSVKIFILYVLAVGLWVFLTFPRFSKYEVGSFGLGSVMEKISKSTFQSGFYSNYIEGLTILEVQREPLYPIVLMLANNLDNNFYTIRILQIIAMALAIGIWLYAIHKHFGLKMACLFYALLYLSPIIPFYSSVLYPYAFHFLFVSAGIINFVRFLEGNSYRTALMSGLCFGISMYERAAFIFLPLFLIVVIWIIHRKKQRLSYLAAVLFIATAYLIPLPWLARNAALGVVGMSQVTGYALGYTFGYLTYDLKNPDDVRLEGYIEEFGTDLGPQKFISDGVLAGEANFQQMDQKVSRLIVKRILRFKRKTALVILNSSTNFPSRLFSAVSFNVMGPQKTPREYYGNRVSTETPRIMDICIFISSILGALWGCIRSDSFFITGSIVAAYVFLYSTIPIQFDSRYRGPIDLFLYCAAAYFFINLLEMLRNFFRKQHTKSI